MLNKKSGEIIVIDLRDHCYINFDHDINFDICKEINDNRNKEKRNKRNKIFKNFLKIETTQSFTILKTLYLFFSMFRVLSFWLNKRKKRNFFL